MNGKCSDMRLIHTGSPLDCCLSPLLYILYTDSCSSVHADRCLVKFVDDSALVYFSMVHREVTVRHNEMLWSDGMTLI